MSALAGPPPAPRWRSRAWLSVVLAIAVVRCLALEADPPVQMPDPTVMDEGLWADSARGRVLFGDWFADDLGNAHLIAPLYSWLLAAVYAVFGVGLWQTRLLSALLSVGTAALAGAIVGRHHGRAAALVATLLLGICPLLDQHGRFAMLESTQSFCLLLSFALLFARRATLWKAALAGAAMGAAMLVKPNSATFGALPLALAFLVQWRAASRTAGASATRAHVLAALACIAGGCAMLAVVGAPVWLAHWREFWLTVQYESGGANWTLGDHLVRLGLIGGRELAPGEHRLTALLRHAPLCSLAVVLLLLRRATGIGLSSPLARPLWIWLCCALLVHETSYDHVARRQVLMLPAMAMLAAAGFATHCTSAAARPWPQAGRWLVVLLPFFLAAKPALARAVGAQLADMGVSQEHGRADLLGGIAVLAAFALLPVLLQSLRCRAERPVHWALRLGPWLLALAAAFEVSQLGALAQPAYSIRTAQQQLESLVGTGDIALGDHAATLLQGTGARTVRRVLGNVDYSSPRPNPDVATRLQPRFVLDYRDTALREFGDVTATGHEVVAEVGLLREPSGTWRFQLQLWRRR